MIGACSLTFIKRAKIKSKDLPQAGYFDIMRRKYSDGQGRVSAYTLKFDESILCKYTA